MFRVLQPFSNPDEGLIGQGSSQDQQSGSLLTCPYSCKAAAAAALACALVRDASSLLVFEASTTRRKLLCGVPHCFLQTVSLPSYDVAAAAPADGLGDKSGSSPQNQLRLSDLGSASVYACVCVCVSAYACASHACSPSTQTRHTACPPPSVPLLNSPPQGPAPAPLSHTHTPPCLVSLPCPPPSRARPPPSLHTHHPVCFSLFCSPPLSEPGPPSPRPCSHPP